MHTIVIRCASATYLTFAHSGVPWTAFVRPFLKIEETGKREDGRVRKGEEVMNENKVQKQEGKKSESV